MLDKKLLSILVCPVTKAPLTHIQNDVDGRLVEELHCKASGLAYPVRDGIPVMLESEARHMNEEELAAL